MGPMVNLLVLNELTLLSKDNWYSAPGPNFLTILSAFETLEHFLFCQMITHTLLIAEIVYCFQRLKEIKRKPMIVNLVL